jgi:hypothetical protein
MQKVKIPPDRMSRLVHLSCGHRFSSLSLSLCPPSSAFFMFGALHTTLFAVVAPTSAKGNRETFELRFGLFREMISEQGELIFIKTDDGTRFRALSTMETTNLWN